MFRDEVVPIYLVPVRNCMRCRMFKRGKLAHDQHGTLRIDIPDETIVRNVPSIGASLVRCIGERSMICSTAHGILALR